MALDRSGVHAALFGRLQARLSGSCPTVSSRIKFWGDVPPSEQPALFLEQNEQVGHQERPGLPTLWIMPFTAYLYVTDDTADGPAARLNQLADLVELAVEDVAKALGSNAYDARVVRMTTDEGALVSQGGLGVALVHIEIRATA